MKTDSPIRKKLLTKFFFLRNCSLVKSWWALFIYIFKLSELYTVHPTLYIWTTNMDGCSFYICVWLFKCCCDSQAFWTVCRAAWRRMEGKFRVYDRVVVSYCSFSLKYSTTHEWIPVGAPSHIMLLFLFISNLLLARSCHLLHLFQFITQKGNSGNGSPPPPSFRQCIQLGACGAKEILPMNPDLPADVFTACLTTPINMAVRWYLLQNKGKLLHGLSLDIVDKWVLYAKFVIMKIQPG